MQINTINDIKIKPLPLETVDVKKIQGYKLFPEIYANIFLCAKKKSGKSTVIYNIVKQCINSETKVLIVSSTVNKDAIYKHIKSYLDTKDIQYECFTSLVSEDGTNVITSLINQLQSNDIEEEVPEIQPKIIIRVDNDHKQSDPNETKKKRPRKLAPEYLVILDDLGNEIKNKAVDQLLKTNRHYKAKVIISSQYLNDLSIASRKQLDYVLIFQGMGHDKLEVLYKDLDLGISFDQFIDLYSIATDQKYCFLYIDVRQESFRICFNKQITI